MTLGKLFRLSLFIHVFLLSCLSRLRISMTHLLLRSTTDVMLFLLGKIFPMRVLSTALFIQATFMTMSVDENFEFNEEFLDENSKLKRNILTQCMWIKLWLMLLGTFLLHHISCKIDI